MHKYKIIYADPPWDYGGNFPSSSDKHAYPLMRTEDICALPVERIAHPDSILFLWATMCKLPEALRVIEAWGFRYVSNGFTWVKTHPGTGNLCVGMGYWTRQNAELCLVAKRGRPMRCAKAVTSVIIAPRGVHSVKPAIVRDHIVRIAGDVPRIELFARHKTAGWDIWGNELANDIDLTAVADRRSDEAV